MVSITQEDAESDDCDYAYACMDWTVGSKAMEDAQDAYEAETGEAIFFGIGSFGPDTAHLGKCYKVELDHTDRPLILQVLNSGADVNTGNFDIQQAAGGFGIHNVRTSSHHLAT